jgi:hypothetical protein
MLESIFDKGVKVITIRDDSKNATPEWLETWGRYSVEIDNQYRARGNDLVELLSDVELVLNPIELMLGGDESNA